jgi:adenylate cyclase
MSDVFEIQEQVAVKVLDGLKLHLTSDEKQKLAERGTENAEAYELYLKAGEYFVRQMKEGFQLAVQLLTEAIKLDPGYANAYSFKANALAAMYSYDRNPELLIEAESLCNDALRIKPDLLAIYYPLSVIYRLQGRLAEAEEAAREFIRRAPDNFYSHFSLGLFYANTGQFTKSIAPYEESVRLMPESRVALFNLAANYSGAKDMEQCAQWAHRALPIEERHLKLHPNDEGSQQHHAMLLFWVGRADEARQAAIKLKDAKDGASLYNIAGLFAMLGDKPEALATIRKAIEAGFRNIRLLKSFLDDDDDGLASLRGMPEYEEVQRKVEKIVAEEEATKPNA